MKKINRQEIFSQPRQDASYCFSFDLPNATVFWREGYYEVLWQEGDRYFCLIRQSEYHCLLRELVNTYEYEKMYNHNCCCGFNKTEDHFRLETYILGSDLTLYRGSEYGEQVYSEFFNRDSNLIFSDEPVKKISFSLPKVYDGEFYSPEGELIFWEKLWQDNQKFYHLMGVEEEIYYEEISEKAYWTAKTEWEQKCIVPNSLSRRNVFFDFQEKKYEQFSVTISVANIDVR